MHAFKFDRSTVAQKRVSEEMLRANPRGELDVSFTNYPDIDLDEYTLYYKVHSIIFYICLEAKISILFRFQQNINLYDTIFFNDFSGPRSVLKKQDTIIWWRNSIHNIV